MSDPEKPKNEVAKPKEPSMMAVLATGLQQMAPELAASLPKNISPEKFISTAITGIRTSKDPKKLLLADRRSLYNAVQTAAAYGLVLDSREAALVPFGDQVQFMPMVQGLVKLARNSGLIATIIAEVVYAHDKFSYRIGIDPSPVHEPDWFGAERGEPVGVWALVTMTDGNKIHAILPKRRVMEIAAGSKNAAQYDPKTGKHFIEWWKKTAIKNVLKYAPKATELEKLDRLANYDDQTQGFDSETGEIIEGKPPAADKPKATGTRAARKVKAAAGDDQPKNPEPEDTNPNITDADFSEQPPAGGDDPDLGLGEYGEEEIPV